METEISMPIFTLILLPSILKDIEYYFTFKFEITFGMSSTPDAKLWRTINKPFVLYNILSADCIWGFKPASALVDHEYEGFNLSNDKASALKGVRRRRCPEV
jgi:hypothetical protein